MSETNLTPEKKMSKARTILVLDDPFFGALAMRMEMRKMTEDEMHMIKKVFGMSEATCAVNGVEISYNPDWIKTLSVQECKGLLAHEVGHVALKHHIRRGERDPRLWNYANDYAIDPILKEGGYELPQGGHIDQKFKDKASEEIYRIIEAEIEKQEGKGGKGGKGGNDDVNPGPGLVQDAPIDFKDKQALQEFEEDLTIAIEHAAKTAKMAGKLPGYLEQIIESEKQHEVDYKELLRDWLVKNVFPDDYTWQRPSRRYLSHGLYLPSLSDGYEVPKLVMYCDTSGSVSQGERVKYADEISGILEEFMCEIDVIYGDVRITNVEHFASDDLPLKLNMKGSGGTYFKPAFDYITKNNIECEALLFFTDMGAFDWEEIEKMDRPNYPVLWMNTCRYEDKHKVPFGTVIPLKNVQEK